MQAVAAPATVSDEPTLTTRHWSVGTTGKAERKAMTRQPGDLPSLRHLPLNGVFRGCGLPFG